MIVAALLSLSGCGVYKPYSRPEVETDGLYRDVRTEDTATMASLSWRELFADAQLQTLIAKGLERNTDLRIARLRVEQAEAVLKNARLFYLPSVSLTPEGGIGRYDGATSKTYNLGASASWEIDIFGRVTHAKRGALEDAVFPETVSVGIPVQLLANRPDVRQVEHTWHKRFMPLMPPVRPSIRA